MPSSAAVSMGSPTSFEPSMATSEWQPASTMAASAEASSTGSCAGGRCPAAAALRIPTGTSLSEVSVPVLSNRTQSTLPAIGRRKGSVQKMPALRRAMSAVLTAMAVCIGKWRGTTEVRMMTQRRSNSCVVRSPFSRPFLKTKADEISAKTKSSISAAMVSRESSETACCENSIICISSPCELEKPVRRTKQRQPPSGVGGTPALDVSAPAELACDAAMIDVPAKRECTRSAPSRSSVRRAAVASPSRSGSRSFICGTDSPVSEASLTTAAPRSSRQSHGTTSLMGSAGGAPGPVGGAAEVPAASGDALVGLRGGRRETRSPGRRSVVESFCHEPRRKTFTPKGLADIELSVLNVRCRCITEVDSRRRIERT
mmetsp:Transcript_32457/g.103530  ORF Transcript_32457/g.103530 Transcript_32457/m.103530 type:complete len:372 (+) Transcript_32457:4540-5655(+)